MKWCIMLMWWEIVVYFLKGKYAYEVASWKPAVIAPPIVVGFQEVPNYQEHVNWRIQAHVGSQETAVLAV